MVNLRHVGSGVGKSHERSTQFHPVFKWSQSVPIPPTAVVMCSPLGLSIIPSTWMTSPISVPCQQPDLDIQYYLWSEGSHSRDCLHILFKGTGAKGRATRELIRGFDILVESFFSKLPL